MTVFGKICIVLHQELGSKRVKINWLFGKNQPFFVYDLRKCNFVSKRMILEIWDQNEQICLVFALRNDYSHDKFSHFFSIAIVFPTGYHIQNVGKVEHYVSS